MLKMGPKRLAQMLLGRRGAPVLRRERGRTPSGGDLRAGEPELAVNQNSYIKEACSWT